MSKSKITNTIFQGLMLAAVIAAALPVPGNAIAQEAGSNNLAITTSALKQGLANIPNIIAGVFYIGGAAMIGAGCLKLKAHAENPIQDPLGKGLGRLGAGTCLIALPAFAQWLINTLNIGSNGAVSQPFGQLQ